MDALHEQLAEALRVCADDLEAEVSAKYPESMLAYPCMVQDKEGDMANVVAARKLLAAYDAAKANGGCANCAALQARIDALMFEHCPDEMTPEQVEGWGKHQRRVSPEEEAKINAGLGLPPPPEQV